MTPHTFTYDYNRHGEPWRANGYICEHGNDMATCTEGDQIHRLVGERMVEWLNNTFIQMRDRVIVRDRILGGSA
jgi:hypothetical protein